MKRKICCLKNTTQPNEVMSKHCLILSFYLIKVLSGWIGNNNYDGMKSLIFVNAQDRMEKNSILSHLINDLEIINLIIQIITIGILIISIHLWWTCLSIKVSPSKCLMFKKEKKERNKKNYGEEKSSVLIFKVTHKSIKA